MDVTKVHLTKKEQKAFDKFDENGEALLTLEEFQSLRHTKLIQERLGDAGPWSSGWPESGLCRLSGYGEEYRRYYLAKQEEKRLDERRYRITTGISITALVISAGSLMVAILALILR